VPSFLERAHAALARAVDLAAVLFPEIVRAFSLFIMANREESAQSIFSTGKGRGRGKERGL